MTVLHLRDCTFDLPLPTSHCAPYRDFIPMGACRVLYKIMFSVVSFSLLLHPFLLPLMDNLFSCPLPPSTKSYKPPDKQILGNKSRPDEIRGVTNHMCAKTM